MATTQIFSLLRLSFVCTTSCFHVCLLSFLFAVLNLSTKALHSNAQRPKLITFMCAYVNALTWSAVDDEGYTIWLMEGANAVWKLQRIHKSPFLIFNRGKMLSPLMNKRMTASIQLTNHTLSSRHSRLEEFRFIASWKTILSRFSFLLVSHKRLSREKSRIAIKSKEEIKQLFVFYVRAKEFYVSLSWCFSWKRWK